MMIFAKKILNLLTPNVALQSVQIQSFSGSEYGKIVTRGNSVFGHFKDLLFVFLRMSQEFLLTKLKHISPHSVFDVRNLN